MIPQSRLPSQILILVIVVNLSVEIHYEFVFEDDQLFAKCTDNPGFQDIYKLYDFSNFSLELGEDGVTASGNLTMVWDVDPADRIEGHLSVLHWDRGVWQPTILNIMAHDFCKLMYDKNQLWYPIWAQHVTNLEEIKSKCIKHKGTIFKFDPYLVKVEIGVGMVIPSGRHRIIITLVAIDSNNVTRPNGICFEMRGEFFKILNRNLRNAV